MVGGSFTTVQQPRIGDLAEVRAGEGGPRARVYGTFRPLGGQVVWAGRTREIRRRQRQGKGGPRVETSTILRSYAIGICEGPITGVTRIWRNNEMVYDVREGSPIAAESARWMQGKTLLLGGWGQLPHPTIEAEAGAGNAPAMRGTAMLVVTDEDLTDMRGAIPAYQFEVRRGRGFVLTSPPYPYEFTEAMDSGIGITGGTLRELPIVSMLPEAMDSGIGITGGELRTILLTNAMLPEAVDSTIGITGGELRTILLTNAMLPEAVDSAIGITGGELRAILITNTMLPEAVDSAIGITGGTLE